MTAMWKRLAGIGAAGVLTLAACGGDDDDAEANVVAQAEEPSAEPSAEPSDEPSDEPAEGGGSDGGTSNASLPSVWPLPAASSIDEFVPYSELDNDLVTTLQGSWVLTGTDLETVIAFYEELLPTMGYEVGARLPLGESIALNVTDPNDPSVTAVVQAGPDPEGAVILNQEKTTNKTSN